MLFCNKLTKILVRKNRGLLKSWVTKWSGIFCLGIIFRYIRCFSHFQNSNSSEYWPLERCSTEFCSPEDLSGKLSLRKILRGNFPPGNMPEGKVNREKIASCPNSSTLSNLKYFLHNWGMAWVILHTKTIFFEN